jgi:hypothetical protein
VFGEGKMIFLLLFVAVSQSLFLDPTSFAAHAEAALRRQEDR